MFENDDALDLAFFLRSDPTGLHLSRALSALTATPPKELPLIDDVERGIAAAEVVAASHGAAGEQLPESVLVWTNQQPAPLGVAMLDLAREAVARVQAHAVSLKEGWFDPELGNAWMRRVDDLGHRLDRLRGQAVQS